MSTYLNSYMRCHCKNYDTENRLTLTNSVGNNKAGEIEEIWLETWLSSLGNTLLYVLVGIPHTL